MPMKKVPPPANPHAYVSTLRGWRRTLVNLLREGDTIKPAVVKRLAREAIKLNKQLGNPQDAAK